MRRVLQTQHTMPTPGWDEARRIAAVEQFRADVRAQGGTIVSERRTRNMVFDRRTEKTTFMFTVDWA